MGKERRSIFMIGCLQCDVIDVNETREEKWLAVVAVVLPHVKCLS